MPILKLHHRTSASKEQAYLIAVSSAVLAYNIAKSCSRGVTTSCECGSNNLGNGIHRSENQVRRVICVVYVSCAIRESYADVSDKICVTCRYRRENIVCCTRCESYYIVYIWYTANITTYNIQYTKSVVERIIYIYIINID